MGRFNGMSNDIDWFGHIVRLIGIGLCIWVLTSFVQCMNDNSERIMAKRAILVKDFNSKLGGSHPLRRLVADDKTSSHISGSYFLFSGAVHGETTEELKVTFSWKTKNGDYVITTVGADKIKVRLNDSIKEPFVSFEYDRDNYSDSDNYQRIIDYYVRYAVINCREDQYKPNVNLDNL